VGPAAGAPHLQRLVHPDPSLPAIRQVKCAGDFEGYLSFGIGVDHHAGLRVFTLEQPARVVLDIAT
jgi:hypothetical protein